MIYASGNRAKADDSVPSYIIMCCSLPSCCYVWKASRPALCRHGALIPFVVLALVGAKARDHESGPLPIYPDLIYASRKRIKADCNAPRQDHVMSLAELLLSLGSLQTRVLSAWRAYLVLFCVVGACWCQRACSRFCPTPELSRSDVRPL